jgi:hypothetical protein
MLVLVSGDWALGTNVPEEGGGFVLGSRCSHVGPTLCYFGPLLDPQIIQNGPVIT